MEITREGIWLVRKINCGDHCKYEGDKLEDMPDIMTRASFEPYRCEVYQKLYKKENSLGHVEMSAKEIVKLIFSCLRKG